MMTVPVIHTRYFDGRIRRLITVLYSVHAQEYRLLFSFNLTLLRHAHAVS